MGAIMDEADRPFASIESAHEYTKLLLDAIEESRAEIAEDALLRPVDGLVECRQ